MTATEIGVGRVLHHSTGSITNARKLVPDQPAAPVPRPHHIAAVMDGNGRWAKAKMVSVSDGHAAGEPAILAAAKACLTAGVRWLTLFAFSTENWNREDAEVAFLMKLNGDLVVTNMAFFLENGIRVRYMGGRDDPVPDFVRAQIEHAEAATKGGDRLTLTLAFNYGAKQEFIDVIERIVDSGVDVHDLTPADLLSYTQWPDMPEVDLLIRTSAEQRLSNFMLLRLAYAELFFPAVLWPDFREQHLRDALDAFASRNRRFGRRP